MTELASGGKLLRVASLPSITRKLRRAMAELSFADPVAYVYNPLDYAWKPHSAYLDLFAERESENLWLGMNPGPYGMAQTGVPFGEIAAVRDYIGISAKVKKPEPEHPKRPITGFECTRSEVSGRRLWGWAAERWPNADAFFARNLVYNYCPLVFMADTGRNITPDKLPADERAPLFEACDRALSEVVRCVGARRVIAVGSFAEQRARKTLADHDLEYFRVPHPSPASPLANRGWSAAIEASLSKQGLQELI